MTVYNNYQDLSKYANGSVLSNLDFAAENKVASSSHDRKSELLSKTYSESLASLQHLLLESEAFHPPVSSLVGGDDPITGNYKFTGAVTTDERTMQWFDAIGNSSDPKLRKLHDDMVKLGTNRLASAGGGKSIYTPEKVFCAAVSALFGAPDGSSVVIRSSPDVKGGLYISPNGYFQGGDHIFSVYSSPKDGELPLYTQAKVEGQFKKDGDGKVITREFNTNEGDIVSAKLTQYIDQNQPHASEFVNPKSVGQFMGIGFRNNRTGRDEASNKSPENKLTLVYGAQQIRDGDYPNDEAYQPHKENLHQTKVGSFNLSQQSATLLGIPQIEITSNRHIPFAAYALGFDTHISELKEYPKEIYPHGMKLEHVLWAESKLNCKTLGQMLTNPEFMKVYKPEFELHKTMHMQKIAEEYQQKLTEKSTLSPSEVKGIVENLGVKVYFDTSIGSESKQKFALNYLDFTRNDKINEEIFKKDLSKLLAMRDSTHGTIQDYNIENIFYDSNGKFSGVEITYKNLDHHRDSQRFAELDRTEVAKIITDPTSDGRLTETTIRVPSRSGGQSSSLVSPEKNSADARSKMQTDGVNQEKSGVHEDSSLNYDKKTIQLKVRQPTYTYMPPEIGKDKKKVPSVSERMQVALENAPPVVEKVQKTELKEQVVLAETKVADKWVQLSEMESLASIIKTRVMPDRSQSLDIPALKNLIQANPTAFSELQNLPWDAPFIQTTEKFSEGRFKTHLEFYQADPNSKPLRSKGKRPEVSIEISEPLSARHVSSLLVPDNRRTVMKTEQKVEIHTQEISKPATVVSIQAQSTQGAHLLEQMLLGNGVKVKVVERNYGQENNYLEIFPSKEAGGSIDAIKEQMTAMKADFRVDVANTDKGHTVQFVTVDKASINQALHEYKGLRESVTESVDLAEKVVSDAKTQLENHGKAQELQQGIVAELNEPLDSHTQDELQALKRRMANDLIGEAMSRHEGKPTVPSEPTQVLLGANQTVASQDVLRTGTAHDGLVDQKGVEHAPAPSEQAEVPASLSPSLQSKLKTLDSKMMMGALCTDIGINAGLWYAHNKTVTELTLAGKGDTPEALKAATEASQAMDHAMAAVYILGGTKLVKKFGDFLAKQVASKFVPGVGAITSVVTAGTEIFLKGKDFLNGECSKTAMMLTLGAAGGEIAISMVSGYGLAGEAYRDGITTLLKKTQDLTGIDDIDIPPMGIVANVLQSLSRGDAMVILKAIDPEQFK